MSKMKQFQETVRSINEGGRQGYHMAAEYAWSESYTRAGGLDVQHSCSLLRTLREEGAEFDLTKALADVAALAAKARRDAAH